MDEVEKAIEDIRRNCTKHHKEIDQRLHDGGKTFTAQEKDLEALKDWQISQNGALHGIKGDIETIKDDIVEIKIDNAKGKPTWTVTITLGLMGSVISALIVYTIAL